MNLADAGLHSDAIHRGGGHIIPTARRAFYAAQLTAQPRLLEPIFTADLTFQKEMKSVVNKYLGQRRCEIIEEQPSSISPLDTLRFYLPATELLRMLISLLHSSDFILLILLIRIELRSERIEGE